MRYRVHKHCRRPDCIRWVVSDRHHEVVYSNYTWWSAWSWACARVEREFLTRRDGPGWIDREKLQAAVDPTLQPDQIRLCDQVVTLVAEDEAPVVAKARERAGSYYDAFSQLVTKALSGGSPSAELMAKAQVVWPELRWQAGDPLVNAQVAGYVGEFATDDEPEPANIVGFDGSGTISDLIVGISDRNDVAENPKIVDTQQISDSGA